MTGFAYSLTLPDGFIDLPTDGLDEEGFRSLAAGIAERFGMNQEAEIDSGLAETTVMLATTATGRVQSRLKRGYSLRGE